MQFLISLLVLILSVCLVSVSSTELNNKNAITGYIASGYWNGKTWPSSEWEFDVARLAVDWSPTEIESIHTYIPMGANSLSFPTWTAYDGRTRSFFSAVGNNISSSFLFSGQLNGAVSNITSPFSTIFNYPQEGDVHIGLQTFHLDGQTQLLSFYENGFIDLLNPLTGERKHFREITNSTRKLSTAITSNIETGEIYMIAENTRRYGGAHRSVITFNPKTGVFTEKYLAALANHDPLGEVPFEMAWMPETSCLMVMYTGTFDQLVYLDPTTGNMGLAVFNLASFNGGGDTVLGFTTNSQLMMGDTWGNIAVDYLHSIIYFQCSSIDSSDMVTTTLCAVPILNPPAALSYVTVQQWPLSYGFAGMQWVQLVSEDEEEEKEQMPVIAAI